MSYHMSLGSLTCAKPLTSKGGCPQFMCSDPNEKLYQSKSGPSCVGPSDASQVAPTYPYFAATTAAAITAPTATFQSTKPVPGTVYYARPTGGGTVPALFVAPRYSSASAPVTASASAASTPFAPSQAPAKSWLPWLVVGGVAVGAAWLVFRN